MKTAVVPQVRSFPVNPAGSASGGKDAADASIVTRVYSMATRMGSGLTLQAQRPPARLSRRSTAAKADGTRGRQLEGHGRVRCSVWLDVVVILSCSKTPNAAEPLCQQAARSRGQ